MTWDLSTDQKEKFLELMDNLGAHSIYYVDGIAEELLKCGLPASMNIEKNYLLIDNNKNFSYTARVGRFRYSPNRYFISGY